MLAPAISRALQPCHRMGSQWIECLRGLPGSDCAGDTHGHGTHCAGTVGGATLGVAPKATIHGVKVLWPSGQLAWIVGAIDWILENAETPAVISMSLGGAHTSQAYNTAISAAHEAGITVVVAAGNSNSDACNFSPAYVPDAITVAATTSEDSRAVIPLEGGEASIRICLSCGLRCKQKLLVAPDTCSIISFL